MVVEQLDPTVRNFPEKNRFSSVIVNLTYVVIVPAKIASMYM